MFENNLGTIISCQVLTSSDNLMGLNGCDLSSLNFSSAFSQEISYSWKPPNISVSKVGASSGSFGFATSIWLNGLMLLALVESLLVRSYSLQTDLVIFLTILSIFRHVFSLRRVSSAFSASLNPRSLKLSTQQAS